MQVSLLCPGIIATGQWEREASPLGASTHRETAATLVLLHPRQSCPGRCHPSETRACLLHLRHHRLLPSPAAQSSSPHFTTKFFNLIQHFHLFFYLYISEFRSVMSFFFLHFGLQLSNINGGPLLSCKTQRDWAESERENSKHLTQWHTQEVMVQCKDWWSFMTICHLTLWIRQVMVGVCPGFTSMTTVKNLMAGMKAYFNVHTITVFKIRLTTFIVILWQWQKMIKNELIWD